MLQKNEKHEKGPDKEDYYSGYYWGNNPYESYEIPDHIRDEQLKDITKANLVKNKNVNLDHFDISVDAAKITLIDYIKIYQERRLRGEEA